MAALFNPFHGKIGRARWWLYQFLIFILAIAGLVLTALLLADLEAGVQKRTPAENAGVGLTIVCAIYMNVSTCLNRLRDSGRSGFWYLTFLLPTVGTGLMIYFCGIEKSPGRFASDTTDPSSGIPMPPPPAGTVSTVRRPATRAPVTRQREFGRRNRA